MSWACLAAGVVALLLCLGTLVPLRSRLGSALSFLPSWVVGEAPLHLAAIALGATLGCGLSGGFAGAPGWAGLALCVAACGGLVVQFVSGMRSRHHFEAALVLAGTGVSRWSWTAEDTRRVLVAVPIRPRAVEKLRDISYVSDATAAQRLDLYRRVDASSATSAAPVLLYFHGGAWVLGDKREQGIPMLEHLASRGYVCVTANYGLSPKARWPRHVLDCKLAIRWVKENIADYGGDPDLVFVSGCSAGGHLAALVALSANEAEWQPEFEDQDTSVAGCIPLYGVYDFVDAEKIGNPNLGRILERHVFEQADLPTLRRGVADLEGARQGAAVPRRPRTKRRSRPGRGGPRLRERPAVPRPPTRWPMSSCRSPSTPSTTSGHRGPCISCTRSSVSPGGS